MRLFVASTLCLSLAVSTNATWLLVNNYCGETLYISDANQTAWTPPIQKIPTATSYTKKIVGEGSVLPVESQALSRARAKAFEQISSAFL